MKGKLKGLIYLLCAAICFLFPRYHVVTAADNSFDVQKFVEVASAQINQMREENGISPIPTAPLLQEMCGQRAEELTSLYSHSRPNGTPWYTILGEYGINMNCVAGENIAAGYDTPESVVEGWMNSDGHRKTILNESYDYFAVGVYYKENDPDYYFYYWDLIFFSSENPFENEYMPVQTTMTTTETTTTTTETTTETTTTTTTETTTTTTETTTTTTTQTTTTTTETTTTTTQTTTETTTTTTETTTTGTTITTTMQNDIIYGDCNLDGKVDLSDAIFLNKYLAGQVGLTRKQMESVNCNQMDGTSVVDDTDADALLQFIILLVDKLPIRAM
ncbi:MAG: CAP domain-containing protein [Ruminococcus sp.]